MKKYLLLVGLMLFTLLPLLSACGQSAEDKEKREIAVEEKETEEKETAEKESVETEKENKQEDPAGQEETTENEQIREEPTIEKGEVTETSQRETPKQPEQQSVAVSEVKKEVKREVKKEEQPQPKPQPQVSQVETPAAVAPAAGTTPIVEPQKETVTVAITGFGQSSILPTASVGLKEGEAVIDVMKRIAAEKGMKLDYSGIGSAIYMEGINGLYEFDHGPLSGWMFKVNGEFSSKSAGAVKVKTGDRIEWVYTTDLGKDVGAKP